MGLRFNANTGKVVIQGEEGTELWCLRTIAKSLERIADSLEQQCQNNNQS